MDGTLAASLRDGAGRRSPVGSPARSPRGCSSRTSSSSSRSPSGRPGFLDRANFESTATLAAYTGVMSAVATLVLISGGLDLSVGRGGGARGAGSCAIALDNGWSTAGGDRRRSRVGAGAGLVNCGLRRRPRHQPAHRDDRDGLRAAGARARRGRTGSSTIIENKPILDLGAATLARDSRGDLHHARGLRSRWASSFASPGSGSNFLAAGSNPIATRRAGIAVWRTLTIVYLLSGVSAAFAGLMLIGFQGASIPVRRASASSSRCSAPSSSAARGSWAARGA